MTDEEIKAEALALAKDKTKNLIFVEDVIAYLPIGKSKFYELFPAKTDEMDALKKALNENKIRLKVGIRKKLYDNSSPTAQIALYKLIGTEEETHRLNGTKKAIDHTSGGKPIKSTFGWDEEEEEDPRNVVKGFREEE